MMKKKKNLLKIISILKGNRQYLMGWAQAKTNNFLFMSFVQFIYVAAISDFVSWFAIAAYVQFNWLVMTIFHFFFFLCIHRWALLELTSNFLQMILIIGTLFFCFHQNSTRTIGLFPSTLTRATHMYHSINCCCVNILEKLIRIKTVKWNE